MPSCHEFPLCDFCGHAACTPELFVHGQHEPHACNVRNCECNAYTFPQGLEQSPFTPGGGSGGGAGASGSW